MLARASEPVPAALQLTAQLAEIVDLTVEGDVQPPRGVAHRLAACLRQVDHRQPAVRQADPAIGGPPFADPVRSTVAQAVAHHAQQVPLEDRLHRRDTHNAAHYAPTPAMASHPRGSERPSTAR